jgi:transcriptional regulator with XRE-family HTH domain
MEESVLGKKRVGATREGAESIGERLTRLRKEKGITQIELAQRLETSQSIVSKYERGDLLLHGELIAKLAAILDVSADELLGVERARAKDKRPTPVVKDRRLVRRIHAIDRLSKRDREALVRTIDAFLARARPEDVHPAQ